MELPGAAYFYTLATVAITFVTFSSLLIILRQTVGAGLSAYDSTVTRFFMQLGFIVIAGALLPPLLALCEAPPDVIWRVSSGFTGAVVLIRLITWPGQRRRALGPTAPVIATIYITLGIVAALLMIANAAGWPWRPAMRIHAVAVTLMLFTTGAAFLVSSKVILEQER
ncbi:MAG TPA: hypothetical protein VGC72_12520 [Candidatus Elarobacter sp.]